MVKVMKKTGQLEEFNADKLKNSIIKSGCDPESAKAIAESIYITATSIKTQVIEKLKAESPETAAAYESYVKTAPEAQQEAAPEISATNEQETTAQETTPIEQQTHTQ